MFEIGGSRTHLDDMHDDGEVDGEREEAQSTQKTQDVIEKGQQQRDDRDDDDQNGPADAALTSWQGNRG